MKVQHISTITRFVGEYPSLSAFLMSASTVPSDSESVSTRAEGSFAGHADNFSLSYKEQDGTVARVSFDGDTLSFSRGGTFATFTRAKSTSFSYVSAIGALPATAYTVTLEVKEREGKLLLCVEYFMHLSNMVQKNTMRWKLF